MTSRILLRSSLLALLSAAGLAAGCAADRVSTNDTAEAKVTAKSDACCAEGKSSCCLGKSEDSAKTCPHADKDATAPQD